MPQEFKRPDVAEIAAEAMVIAREKHPDAKFFAFVIDWDDRAGQHRTAIVPLKTEEPAFVVRSAEET